MRATITSDVLRGFKIRLIGMTGVGLVIEGDMGTKKILLSGEKMGASSRNNGRP